MLSRYLDLGVIIGLVLISEFFLIQWVFGSIVSVFPVVFLPLWPMAEQELSD